MKKDRIVCHVTSTHNNHDQRILLKECCSLYNAGYKVFQVAQGNDEQYKGVKLIGTHECHKGRFYRLLIRPYRVYRIAKKIDADIYHFHDMELLPYSKKLKKIGKKVIFDYHEDYASRFEESDAFHLPAFVMKIISKIYSKYEKNILKRLDAVISVTPYICDRLKKINSNTILITNFPIVDKESSWYKECGYNETSNYVFYAGQISCRSYGLHYIVQAIQEIKRIKLIMCGPERVPGDLNYIKSFDKKNKIDYLGNLEYNDLPKLYSKSICSFCITPYSKNSNGRMGSLGVNKLFESMMCGVPVIFTNYSLWNNVNSKYDFGTAVEYGDINAIKESVLYYVNHRKDGKIKGKNGRKAVLKYYNWNNEEIKLINLYRTL